MKTQHGSGETTNGSQPSNGRTIWISAAVFAACLALYIAEQNGFRLFDENVRSIPVGETVVPSPLEILTVLGTTSLGVCAGLVSLIATIGRIIQVLSHTREASGEDGKFTGPTTECTVHQSAS